MKKLFALAAMIALLTACGGTDCPPPLPEDLTPAVGAPKAPVLEPEPMGATETVSYELNYVRMSLELPDNWGYSYVGVGVNGGGLHASPADVVGICFWPDAAEDMGGGALALYHYAEPFAVCGTGLKSEDITFESGLTGSVGTYDDRDLWDYILFRDTPGSYVVMNEGAENWWDVYGEQAMTILQSVRVGEGLLTESEAVSQAESVRTVDCNAVRAEFDGESGTWRIHFYKDYTAGGDQTVWIGSDGSIETKYGE